MQIRRRSAMIMISAVISLSHHSLFGCSNVLWNAPINTKQTGPNGLTPQPMARKCRTPAASIREPNAGWCSLSEDKYLDLSKLLTPRRAARMTAMATIQLNSNNKQSIFQKGFRQGKVSSLAAEGPSVSSGETRYNLRDLAINYPFPSIYEQMSALSSEQGHRLQ